MDYEQEPVIETVALLPGLNFEDLKMKQKAETIISETYTRIGGRMFDFRQIDDEIGVSRYEDQVTKRVLCYILNTLAKAESGTNIKRSEILKDAAERIAAIQPEADDE